MEHSFYLNLTLNSYFITFKHDQKFKNPQYLLYQTVDSCGTIFTADMFFTGLQCE
jgi:hypothetical protein